MVWRYHTPTYHFDNNNAIPIRIDVKLKSSTIKLVRDPIAHERKAWIGQIVTTLKLALLEKKLKASLIQSINLYFARFEFPARS